jgi:hypothetical protein
VSSCKLRECKCKWLSLLYVQQQYSNEEDTLKSRHSHNIISATCKQLQSKAFTCTAHIRHNVHCFHSSACFSPRHAVLCSMPHVSCKQLLFFSSSTTKRFVSTSSDGPHRHFNLLACCCCCCHSSDSLAGGYAAALCLRSATRVLQLLHEEDLDPNSEAGDTVSSSKPYLGIYHLAGLSQRCSLKLNHQHLAA